ncbi:ArsR family transcriptional regulator [Knoellia sinensis KCTC 19936]|uniref:ArsR family transcriptional regulator n=1 Tax=Knoellia sinensis KCTC 19936 TaxID=1385520 RepID=A0A0A0J7G9_9MICO|nr:metalloregulator ArsR/SmtB family transcription factor [Knoellia sinensis]KGN31516.1 ArsR family transcriptional regulator [Knoellia sinensis KCTC 19936]
MDVFEALADPVRRDLLRRLVAGPARVVDLAADHTISRPAISRHLRVLTEAGLVFAEDIGRERHYRLERAGLAPASDYVAALMEPALATPARTPAAAPAPRFDESVLDGLDLEVRRTVRERRTTPTPQSTDTQQNSTEETA